MSRSPALNFLVVRMFPAMTAEIDGEDVNQTYTGPRNIPAPVEARMIRELAQTGDFEAQVTWAIGLDNKHPFTVTASNDELVVEISRCRRPRRGHRVSIAPVRVSKSTGGCGSFPSVLGAGFRSMYSMSILCDGKKAQIRSASPPMFFVP